MRTLVFLSARIVGTGNHEFYIGDSLESIRQYLEVTAMFDDGTVQTVDDYIIANVEESTTIESANVFVEYRGKTDFIVPFSVVVRPSGAPVYQWNFKKSLIDERQGIKAIPISYYDPEGNRYGNNGPIFYPGRGVFFGTNEQALRLLPVSFKLSEKLYDKTVKIDLPYFTGLGEFYHTRFLTTTRTPSEPNFDCGVVYQWLYNNTAGSKWNFYGGSTGWASGFTDLPNKNSIAGKTVSIYFRNDGKVKLSLDGVSKGVSSIGFGQDCYGLQIGSDDHVRQGSTFYKAWVASVEIYEGDV